MFIIFIERHDFAILILQTEDIFNLGLLCRVHDIIIIIESQSL